MATITFKKGELYNYDDLQQDLSIKQINEKFEPLMFSRANNYECKQTFTIVEEDEIKRFYYTVKTDKTVKHVQVYSILNNVPQIEMNIHDIDLYSNTENKVKEKISNEKNIAVNKIEVTIL